MAVPLAFRLMILLAPSTVRVAKWAEGPGVSTATNLGRSVVERLHDPSESDADLSAALSTATGTVSEVATFTGTFELRRAQLSWSLLSAAGLEEDVRVCTFHHIKLSGGTPVDTWAAGDFTTLSNAYAAFWNAIKPWFPDDLVWETLKFYKDGPDIEPPQVPVYEEAVGLAGTSAASAMPPQVALSVTEKAGSKLYWGRFFLPAPAVAGPASAGSTTVYGRPSTALLTAVADAGDTLYEAARVANLPFVVYRRTLPERLKRSGATLAARAASAWEISELQIDDVFDVIRSRRFDGPTLRVQRGIGA
jgi:hypothetical protein